MATFVGSPKMNLLEGTLTGGEFTLTNGFALPVDATGTQGPVTLGVRPDDLLPTAATGGSGARVALIEHLGPRAIVTLDVAGTELTSVVETARLTGITEGGAVDLAVRAGACHLFDTVTGRRVAG